MEKLCKGCGKAFEVKPSLDRIKYCSQQCKQQAKRVTLVCRQCGKNWWTWKSQTIIPGRPGAGQFCSKACAGLAKSGPRNGISYFRRHAKNNGVKTRVADHRQVMESWMVEVEPSHPFLVDVEGMKMLNPKLRVHHIDRTLRNNGRENLLVVTHAAHLRIHRKGTKPEPWECWPSNPTIW